VHLDTSEDVEAVLVCNLEVIVSSVRPSPACLVSLTYIYLRNIVVDDIRMVCVSKRTDESTVEIKTEV